MHSGLPFPFASSCLLVPIADANLYCCAFPLRDAVPQLSRFLREDRNEVGDALKDHTAPAPVFEKTQFSMLTEHVREYVHEAMMVRGSRLQRVVLFGIETHVCVLQTAMDLLEQGVDVHVVVDGVSSQRVLDRTVALSRLQSLGAFLTSTESLMLGLLGDAAHPKFKEVSEILKEHNQTPNHLDHM